MSLFKPIVIYNVFDTISKTVILQNYVKMENTEWKGPGI